MITLNLKREPYWLDLLHGVRVHVRPASTALVMAARVAAYRHLSKIRAAIQAAMIEAGQTRSARRPENVIELSANTPRREDVSHVAE